MFTQFAVSLLDKNYIFKIKLDDIAINFFMDRYEEIEKFIYHIGGDFISKDEYQGEIFGFSFEGSNQENVLLFMKKIKAFFVKNSLTIYDYKSANLKERLELLEEIDFLNHNIINRIKKS